MQISRLPFPAQIMVDKNNWRMWTAMAKAAFNEKGALSTSKVGLIFKN
jgi:hypothetical protein